LIIASPPSEGCGSFIRRLALITGHAFDENKSIRYKSLVVRVANVLEADVAVFTVGPFWVHAYAFFFRHSCYDRLLDVFYHM
jgi:type IV secretory pathway ATPase VirB11/archaellum biosynthesis ATPase